MSRRIGYDRVGSIHHVTQRGNNHNRIFPNPSDKDCFVRMLSRYVEEFGIGLLYFVVMDNHYHLLVEVGHISLDRFMQRLNRAYSWYFSRRYKRTGTIYEGRYHNRVVTNDPYFKAVVHYIAQNPVKAQSVEHPVSYRWGAHAQICCAETITIIDQVNLMNHFSFDLQEAYEEYLSCVEDDTLDKIALGTPITDVAIEVPERLWTLFNTVVEESKFVTEERMRRECVIDAIIGSDKFHRINSVFRPLRDAFILLAVHDGKNYKQIAEFLGVSRETVRRVAVKV